MKNDSATIANYMKPEFVLDGWKPQLSPIILTQPKSVKVKIGQSAQFEIEAAAIPNANYQWYKDGIEINGATDKELNIEKSDFTDSGRYYVIVKNNSGSVKSSEVTLKVEQP